MARIRKSSRQTPLPPIPQALRSTRARLAIPQRHPQGIDNSADAAAGAGGTGDPANGNNPVPDNPIRIDLSGDTEEEVLEDEDEEVLENEDEQDVVDKEEKEDVQRMEMRVLGAFRDGANELKTLAGLLNIARNEALYVMLWTNCSSNEMCLL